MTASTAIVRLTPKLIAPSLALFLAACSVGPRYTAPAPTLAAPLIAPAQATTSQAYDPSWWISFDDPVLSALMTRALSGNLDLKIAQARIRESRALFNDAKRDLFPRVTAVADYTRSDAQIPGSGPDRVNIESAEVGFDARWELDVFGRVRHEVQSARAESQAAEEDLQAAKVSVAAEIARNYLTLRGVQAQRVVAQSNVGTADQTLKLTLLRHDAGGGDLIDVESARARLNATQALIPALNRREAETINRLAVLSGAQPGALDIDLSPAQARVAPRSTPLAIGDASTFLRRRPDVRAAERRLAAQTARTGVATADLFPRFSVAGFVGLLTGNVSDLFGGASKAYSVTPSVSWSAFDFGGARARLRAQQARGDISQAQYDQTVLNAVEDLQDALVAYRERQAELVNLANAASAAHRASDLAQMRFEQGSIDFLRVLDAQRVSLEAEDALIQSQTAANIDVVAIYKALGGA